MGSSSAGAVVVAARLGPWAPSPSSPRAARFLPVLVSGVDLSPLGRRRRRSASRSRATPTAGRRSRSGRSARSPPGSVGLGARRPRHQRLQPEAQLGGRADACRQDPPSALPGTSTTMMLLPWVLTSASATPTPLTRWLMMSAASLSLSLGDAAAGGGAGLQGDALTALQVEAQLGLPVADGCAPGEHAADHQQEDRQRAYRVGGTGRHVSSLLGGSGPRRSRWARPTGPARSPVRPHRRRRRLRTRPTSRSSSGRPGRRG